MKKIFLATSILTYLSFSNFNVEVKSGIKENREGFLYKDINKISFHNENLEREYTLSDIKVENKYIFANLKLSTENIKKVVNPSIVVGVRTPEFQGTKLTYDFAYNPNVDKFNKKKAGNKDHKISIINNERFKIESNINHIDSKIRKYDIGAKFYTKNLELGMYNQVILDEEIHLKEAKNLQNEINKDDNDAHNHDEYVNELKFLDYNIETMEENYGKLNFSNRKHEGNIGLKKTYNNIGFNINGIYKYTGLKTAFGNNLNFDINQHIAKLNLGLEKEIFKNVYSVSNFDFNYKNLRQIKHSEKDTNDGRGSFTKVMGGDVYSGVNEFKLNISTNISYLHYFSNNLSIYSSLGINARLKASNKEIYENTYNLRKKAVEAELERVRIEKENLSEEKLAEKNKEIEKYKVKIEEANLKLKQFDSKENMEILINDFNDARRSDVNERKEEFKTIAKNKNLSEIEKLFTEKNNELKEFEAKYPMVNNREARRDFRVSPYDSKEKKVEKYIEGAKKHNIENPEEFANKYFELNEYKGVGIYAKIKSDIINKRRVINNELNSNKRSLNTILNSIYPNESILNNLKLLDDDKKYSYEIGVEFNPFVSVIYYLSDNFSLNGSVFVEIGFSKNITRNKPVKNHIHVLPKLEFKYSF